MTTYVGESARRTIVDRAHGRIPTVNVGRLVRRKWLVIGAVVVTLAVTLWMTRSRWVPDWGRPVDNLVLTTVSPGELTIVVTERGNLESQQVTQVLCEVDDIPGDNVNGTPIVWIVPNGSSVKKGDPLVELDAAPHRERLDVQILATERAKSEQIQAEARYQNQITQNETTYAEASLKVKLAELELEMYKDENSGTFQLEVEEIKRLIDDVNNEILAAQANLELKKNDKLGIETLFKLGYAGKNERDRSRLDHLQAESQHAAKMNRLKTHLSTLAKKENYERKMQLLQLDGKLQTSLRSLAQTELDNTAKLSQVKAAMEAANESLKKEEERLVRNREQVEKCKITAPSDGMVAFAVGDYRSSEEIREGAPVRPKQVILTLPNLRQMQVKMSVHESVLDQIQTDLPATIRVESFPDRTYRGTVKTVAVLPDQGGWMSSDIKVYQTIVAIDEEVEQLKPGMTAVVDIHIAKICDVLTVPVQAVMQIEQMTWCYVQSPQGVERRTIQLGRTNDKFVEVRDGLQANEQVVLNPMAIVESERAADGEGNGTSPGNGDRRSQNGGRDKPAFKKAPVEKVSAEKAAANEPSDKAVSESRVSDKRRAEKARADRPSRKS